MFILAKTGQGLATIITKQPMFREQLKNLADKFEHKENLGKDWTDLQCLRMLLRKEDPHKFTARIVKLRSSKYKKQRLSSQNERDSRSSSSSQAQTTQTNPSSQSRATHTDQDLIQPYIVMYAISRKGIIILRR